jgi:hypothetical protein
MLIRKALIPEKSVFLMGSWTLYIYCISTVFIVVFSVQAIFAWPSIVEKCSILMACLLPTGMVLTSQVSKWVKEKQSPNELYWVLLVFIFGVISSLSSENPWASLKAMTLFVVSGPLIFLTTKSLFKSTENQKIFLWMTSVTALLFCLFGAYEYSKVGGVFLFSRNPLVAGALLLLLSASTMILLSRSHLRTLIPFFVLGLSSSLILIATMAKKSHALSLIAMAGVFVCLRRRHLRLLLGFVVFIFCLLYYSAITPSINNKLINFNSSLTLRAENYFFGYHVFIENPVWGSGYKANYNPSFTDYKVTLNEKLSKKQYQKYIRALNTFENIILTYLVEWGFVFSFTYFGGALYIVASCLRRMHKRSQEDIEGMLLVSVIIGFMVMSLTFDTLRFPNLNWIFHSLLGLLVNLTDKQLK